MDRPLIPNRVRAPSPLTTVSIPSVTEQWLHGERDNPRGRRRPIKRLQSQKPLKVSLRRDIRVQDALLTDSKHASAIGLGEAQALPRNR